jgi:hypothetical protein
MQRLAAYERVEKEQQVRLVTTLESGLRRLARRAEAIDARCGFGNDGAGRRGADDSACRKHARTPEERALALLRGNGRLTCLIASPRWAANCMRLHC